MFKTVEDLQQMSRSQIEATTQSAAVMSRGLQQIVQEASEFSKKSMEESSAAFGKLVGVKTLDGVIQVQTDFAKSSYETYMAGAKRFGELFASLARDSYKPFEGLAEQNKALVTQ